MRSGPRSLCPVNVAVEILGDRWTLLVLRDLMLKGRVTFKSMVEAEEGIATNILADRLSRLEAEGIVEKVRDESDGRRVRYGLSEKGLDLAPVLVDMMVWSATYYKTAAPPEEIDAMRFNRRRYLAGIRASAPRTVKRHAPSKG
jgi:DNA-binding HxlR family transcriptional regulator